MTNFKSSSTRGQGWCTCVLVWTNHQPYDDVKIFGAVSDFSQVDEGFDQSINV